MSQLFLPASGSGINLRMGQAWWETPEGGRLSVETTPGGVLLQDGAFPWTGPRTLLVVGPVRSWLAEGSLGDRTAALHVWRDRVRALAAEAAPGTVHLGVHASVPRGLDELVALADARRWPGPDLDLAASRLPGDPVMSGCDGDDADPVVGAFRSALGESLAPGVRPSWITQSLGVADALAALRDGVDAHPAMTLSEAVTLRESCRTVFREIVRDGVHVSGRRDLLLWPVPVVAGRIPLDVAAELAAEVLRGQLERPTEWPADLECIGELERQVAVLRAELDRAEAAEPSLATLGGRALLRRLGRRVQ